MYIEIDYNKVKGYGKLSETAKEVFRKTYKAHNSAQGTDYKESWKPEKVAEYSDHLKVTFSNGDWLHYYGNGSWG